MIPPSPAPGTDALIPGDRDRSAASEQVRVVRDPVAWESLEAEWRALFDASPTAAPPLDWEWVRAWWRIYGPSYGASQQALRILTVRRDGRLLGLLPLYVGTASRSLFPVRRLGFLSTGEAEHEETCAEYLDLLHLPGEERACVQALAQALAGRDAPEWDELRLTNVAGGSPLLGLRDHLPGAWRLTVSTLGTCPLADLSGGYEAYLARLSANMRQQARRLVRAVERDGIGFTVAREAADVDPYFDELVRLHQARWTAAGRPGCFGAERFRQFHRALTQSWVPRGIAVLGRLAAGAEPLALVYGFRIGSKFHFYQSGVARDARGGLQSPGTALHLLLMADLAERGITEYDFLLTARASYKQRFATGERPMVELSGVRPTLRSRLARVTGRLEQGGKRAWRLLHGRPVAPSSGELSRHDQPPEV